ncbi:hypothetical protein GWK47_003916 [Chionoecetes opilio]|uniref:Uncharacterized protein n=1 Tax=Chionoecetes opilio TaxID=41210 RepID=A0A8J5D079_CHIOP|nr:hypothetical protein GWK47_003916 [Chionoecetes opilio]
MMITTDLVPRPVPSVKIWRTGVYGRPYLPDHPRQASSGRPHPVTPPADDVHEPTFVAWSGCLRQTGGTTSPARWRPHTSASHVRPSRKPMDVLSKDGGCVPRPPDNIHR